MFLFDPLYAMMNSDKGEILNLVIEREGRRERIDRKTPRRGQSLHYWRGGIGRLFESHFIIPAFLPRTSARSGRALASDELTRLVL